MKHFLVFLAGILALTSDAATTFTVPMNSNAVVTVPGFWQSNSVATITNLNYASNALRGAMSTIGFATNATYATNAGVAAYVTGVLTNNVQGTNVLSGGGSIGQLLTVTATGAVWSNAPAIGGQTQWPWSAVTNAPASVAAQIASSNLLSSNSLARLASGTNSWFTNLWIVREGSLSNVPTVYAINEIDILSPYLYREELDSDGFEDWYNDISGNLSSPFNSLTYLGVGQGWQLFVAAQNLVIGPPNWWMLEYTAPDNGLPPHMQTFTLNTSGPPGSTWYGMTGRNTVTVVPYPTTVASMALQVWGGDAALGQVLMPTPHGSGWSNLPPTVATNLLGTGGAAGQLLTATAAGVAWSNAPATVATATNAQFASYATNAGSAVTAGTATNLLGVSNIVTRTELAGSNYMTATLTASQIAASNLLNSAQVGTQVAGSNYVDRTELAGSNYLKTLPTAFTNVTLYGSSGGTNWTVTSPSGWLNTNSGTGGSVSIASGNVTASGTNTAAYFSGNGSLLTGITASAAPSYVLTNNQTTAVTLGSAFTVSGAATNGTLTVNTNLIVTATALRVQEGGADVMVITNNRVGIWTTTPSVLAQATIAGTSGTNILLELATAATGAGAEGVLRWVNSTDLNSATRVGEIAVIRNSTGSLDEQDMVFRVCTDTPTKVERLRIKGQTGWIGVGKTNPAVAVDVVGSISATGTVTSASAAHTNYDGVIRATGTSPGSVPAIDIPSWPSTNKPALTITPTGIVVSNAVTGNLGAIRAGTNYVSGGATVMGRVSVGSAVSAYTLDVNGTLRVTGTSGTNQFVLDQQLATAGPFKTWNRTIGATLDTYIVPDDNYKRVLDISQIGTQGGGPGGGLIRFITNPGNSDTGVERLRIEPNGNFGIGNSAPPAMLSVGGDARIATTLIVTNNVTVPSGSVTATNFALTLPYWVDCPGQIFWATGRGAGSAVTNSIAVVDVGNGMAAMEFQQTNGSESLFCNAEAPHNIAVTNAASPASALYVEPHLHVRSETNAVAPNTNVTLRVIWRGCGGLVGNTNSLFITNTITVGLGLDSYDVLAEVGHYSYTNWMPSIASTFPMSWTRVVSATGEYPGNLVIKCPSIHVPVGNRSTVGTASDNAP